MKKCYKHKQTGKIAGQAHNKDYYNVGEQFIANEVIPAWAIENSNDWEEIKEKEFRFISEDGVRMYKGDYAWIVFDDNIGSYPIHEIKIYMFTPNLGQKTFSTKAAAQSYIDSRKVKFVSEDGVDLYIGSIFYALETKTWIIHPIAHTMDTLCNQQRAKEVGILWFSKRENAEAYIQLHKPQYTAQQIKKAIKEAALAATMNNWLFVNVLYSKLGIK